MGAARLPSGGRSRIMADINITPLTDIFLVLLIIFMVTTATMVDTGANVVLPEVGDTQSAPREITVTVTQAREVFINGDAVALDDVQPVLRELLATNPDMPVVLEGDRELIFGEAVRVLSAAQAAGAKQIAIAADRAVAR